VENVLTPVFRELSLRLKSLRERVSREADKFELSAFAERAAEIARVAAALVDQAEPGCVYWVEASGQGRRGRRVTLACSPIEVAPLLREHLFSAECSTVLTSATLATGRRSSSTSTKKKPPPPEPTDDAPPPPPIPKGFAHIVGRLGCEGAEGLILGSPFDHAGQVELFIDRTMPSPAGGRGGGSGYVEELVPRILDHLIATDGGAFVLFTSFATLYAVADELADPLRELDLPLLVQGRDGSRGLILERFRADERSVLFGAASFWQGIDVRGRGLRNVVITRLPFDPPDRPLTEARLELIQERGGNPFMDDSLPRAVIRFKQGFGRLIRSSTDRGRVVVLDPRIVTARYGRLFLNALPEGVTVLD
jgi:ATP-dependent DNA helicase DinG